jgi:nitrite reductase (cytochrome c-552)
VFGVLVALVTAGTVGVTALLMNIAERKAEHRQPFVRVVEVTEDDTDPAKWGKNWPS